MHAEAFHPQERDDGLLMPVLMALGLHAALLLLLVLSGWWQPAPIVVSVAGPVVQASLAVTPSDVAAAEQAMAEAPKPVPVETAPPPQPVPSPQPEISPEEVQPVPQEQQPVPDTVDQEAVARLALQAEQAREREEQEARQRQEQIDLTERERQDEAERKQRLREQQLADIRRQRDEAQRQTRMEEQRLQQLADRPATPPPQTEAAREPVQAGGNNGVDTDLRAQYAMALTRAIESHWLRPDSVVIGSACRIRIIQLRGGEVISAEVLPGCAYDAIGQRSVEAAVLRAQPLPYDGFETVFQRDIQLNFRATED